MSAAIAITRRDLTAGELRAGAARSREAQASRRMLAIALVLEGVDRKSAAETCGWIGRRCGTGYTATMRRGSPGIFAYEGLPDETIGSLVAPVVGNSGLSLNRADPDRDGHCVRRFGRANDGASQS